MKKIILMLLVIAVGLFGSSKCDSVKVEMYLKQLRVLTNSQKVVLVSSLIAGQEYGFAYTLAAIGWRESQLGVYSINLGDRHGQKFPGAYGPYQALLSSVMDREGATTNWTASRIAERLVTDLPYAEQKAIEELSYWKRVWSTKATYKKYSHMVGSYRAGWASIECGDGAEYAEDILLRIRAIRLYLKEQKFTYLGVLK